LGESGEGEDEVDVGRADDGDAFLGGHGIGRKKRGGVRKLVRGSVTDWDWWGGGEGAG
jgi:hypothetical protein